MYVGDLPSGKNINSVTSLEHENQNLVQTGSSSIRRCIHIMDGALYL